MDKILAPIKQRILQYVEYKGLTKGNFFESIEVSASNFRSKSLFSEVGGDVIAKISSIYPELNLEWLVSGNGNMLKDKKGESIDVYSLKTDTPVNDQLIPLYDISASASVVEIFSNSSTVVPMDHIKIPNLPKCDGAIHITGDSMYPLLKSGDIVLYREVQDKSNIVWGEMYILYINNKGDEFFFCKYIHRSDNEGYVKLVSQNQHHQAVEFPLDSIQQIAIIKASIRVNSIV